MKLCRWNNRHGSSAGYWLVEELPLALVRSPQDGRWLFLSPWEVSEIDPDLEESALPTAPTYEELRRRCPCLKRFFSSRAEALLALEAELSGEPSSSLAEVLS